jgi:hypothetical protein
MDTPHSTPEPAPHDTVDAEVRVAELTGMTRDAARTFLEFHTGMRWLRRDRD